MNKPFDAFVDADEYTKLRHAGDLAFDLGAHRVTVGNYFPGIGRQLLDAERETLVFDVYPEHLGFDDISFFE